MKALLILFAALFAALVAIGPAHATTDDPAPMMPMVSAGRVIAWPDLDGSYAPCTDKRVPMLHSLGWRDRPNFAFRTFAGAEHNATAWRQRIDIPLAFIDAKDP